MIAACCVISRSSKALPVSVARLEHRGDVRRLQGVVERGDEFGEMSVHPRGHVGELGDHHRYADRAADVSHQRQDRGSFGAQVSRAA